jgi:4-diphosphocytidyl-2-C-methyl-D-erythritol kinase
MTVACDAHAKLNTWLRVLARRDDGFHEIDTVMIPIDLADRVVVRARDDDTVGLVVEGDAGGVPCDESNLVVKAARVVQQRSACGGVDIRLRKVIPPGAGLGGGSSDAAAAVKAMNVLWGLSLSREDLLSVCAEIGSDVPFFLDGRAARCRGRGEVTTTVEVRDTGHYVLAFSPPLGTAEVYARFDEIGGSASTAERPHGLTDDGVLHLRAINDRELTNDLAPAAYSLSPAMERAACALREAGIAHPSVTGSGSCVFGCVDSELAARRARDELARRGFSAACARSCVVGRDGAEESP